MKKTFLFSLLLIVVLCLSLPFSSFATEEELMIRLESTAESVQPGEEMTITLWMDQNPGFINATLQLQYDPTALNYVSASVENAVLDQSVMTLYTETAGTVTVTVGALPAGEGGESVAHTATGQLLTVTFQVKEDCTGYITVTAGGSATGGENTVVVANTNVTVESQIPQNPEPPACEHTQQEQIPMVYATCTEPGWTEGSKCADCGEVLVAPQYIEPYGHKPSESVAENVIPAGCQTDGSYEDVVYCSICFAELSREVKVIPSTGQHNYFIEQERVDPTCTEDGYVIMACECGESHNELLPATGHKEVVDAAVEATCLSTGLTEGSHCEVCGEIFVAQEETPLGGHTEVILSGEAATCQSTGWTDGVICSVCETVLKEQEQTPMVDHMEELIPGVAATCTEPGLTDGAVCAFCNMEMTAQEVIPALGHTENYVPAVAPTCSATGQTEGTKCALCSMVMSGCETVAKLPHTEMVLRPVEPTCSAEGKTEGKYCMDCGYVIEAQATIPPLAHTPQVIESVSPTCATVGWTEGSRCEICSEILEEPQRIPTTAHTVQLLEGHDATCSQTGLTDGAMCSVCETVLEQQLEIPRLEHQYDHGCDLDCNVCGAERLSVTHAFGEWMVLREATKDAPGEQYRLCRHCTFRETRAIPMLTNTQNRGLIIGIAYVIMVGSAVAILVVLRKRKSATES